MNERTLNDSDGDCSLAIVCGGGSLPYALADAAVRRGRRVVLFALRGWADPQRVAAYPHHWSWVGQIGRLLQLAEKEGCREIVFIGSIVRPARRHLFVDIRAIWMLPRLFRLLKGGDDHLQSGLGRIFEERGFRLLAPHEVAPELLMPRGPVGGRMPNDRDSADIAKGIALLHATSPFDIGQAVVVANNHVLAVEGPEGTDQMLGRIVELRSNRRIRAPLGTGVLVKAPKDGQDHRIDLPSIGPKTVEGVKAAGLAGIAVVAGQTIVADHARMAEVADQAGVFVVGVDTNGIVP